MGRLRWLTAGESHGQALGVTLEGLPAGIPLTADGIALDLRRRQGGYGRGARQTIEKDRAETEAWLKSDPTSYLATIDRKDFLSKTTLTVGRAADNDVRIDSPDVQPMRERFRSSTCHQDPDESPRVGAIPFRSGSRKHWNCETSCAFHRPQPWTVRRR